MSQNTTTPTQASTKAPVNDGARGRVLHRLVAGAFALAAGLGLAGGAEAKAETTGPAAAEPQSVMQRVQRIRDRLDGLDVPKAEEVDGAKGALQGWGNWCNMGWGNWDNWRNSWFNMWGNW